MPGYRSKPPSPRLNVAHPLARGLLVCMPFNELAGATVYDLSGKGNHGTIVGGVTNKNTPWGSGYNFDGSTGYINIGSFDFSNTGVTFAALVYSDSSGGDNTIIGENGPLASAYNFILDDQGGFVVFFGGLVSGTNRMNVATPIPTEQWVVLVVTCDINDSNKTSVYYDGELIDAQNLSNPNLNWGPMAIGSRANDSADKRFKGNMSGTKIWDRPLSQNEISQLFHDPFCMLRFPNIFSVLPFAQPLTDNVYHAARHILTTYDKLPSSEIDFTNLQAERGYWKVGRQLTERKRSNEYLRELARQSFIGIFPTRTGKRGLKAWREDRTIIATHDESEIEKILKFEKTPISKVYNDFTINFDRNPGTKKFNKTLFITKTDDPGDAGFPTELESTGADTSYALPAVCESVTILKEGLFAISTKGRATFAADPSGWAKIGGSVSFEGTAGNKFLFGTIRAVNAGSKIVYFDFRNTFSMKQTTYTSGTFYSNGTAIQKWKTYVGGLNDYATGKAWWTICNESYKRTLTVNPLPRDLGDCYWFPDNEDFGKGSGGSNNAAFYYLQHLVEWTTRQKYVTEYVLKSFNAANVRLEMFDPIYFNDQKYTNNNDLIGWINKVKIVPHEKTPRVIIELLLEPTDIITRTYIIETGTQPNTITESGSEADTYEEGAQ